MATVSAGRVNPTKREVVRGVQQLLNVNGHYPRLKEDGIVGRETRQSFNTAPPRFQDLVGFYTDARGQSLKELLAPKPFAPKGKKEPSSEVVEAISKYCSAFGVSTGLAMGVASIESEFDPDALNPSGAAGLFQITRYSISQVQQSYPRLYFPMPAKGRTDLSFNAMVGVGYLHYCAKAVGVNPTSSSPADWARIYGAFNLGPHAFDLWERGLYSNETLVKAWSNQASTLRRGGIAAYLGNVRDHFQQPEVA